MLVGWGGGVSGVCEGVVFVGWGGVLVVYGVVV